MPRRESVEVSPRPHPVNSPTRMAEPPPKRARRTDSSTMWEMSDRRTHTPESGSDYDRKPRRSSYAKEEARRDSARGRDDRRYRSRSRSRSRDRRERRWERSRSRDRRDRDWVRDRRDRSVSRDRHYDRRGYATKGDRFRDRSRSPYRNGTRDRTRTPPPRRPRTDRRDDRRDYRPRDDYGHANGASESRRRSPGRNKDEMDLDLPEDNEEDIEEAMRRNMGFTRFRSTKNTKVPGNDIYGVRKERKTVYRQYMNRAGGFNRPLSPTR